MTLYELLLPTLLLGLFGGAHCALMCGGVSSVLATPREEPDAAPKRRLPLVDRPRARSLAYTVAFNAGRVASYTLLGAAIGALGRLPFGAPLDAVKLGFRLFAAASVVAVGLHLLGLPSFVRALEGVGAPVWRRIAPTARRLLPLRTPWHALAAGALWAFMPCGLLYAALAVAATEGTPLHGALAMAAFGVGTLPVMSAIGLAAGRLTRAVAQSWIRRTAGAVVLSLGLWSSGAAASDLATGVHGAHACCPRP